MHIGLLGLLLITATTSYTSPTTRPTDSALEAHAAKLRQTLPHSFTLVIQKPFVVIGDEEPDVVRRRATQTVGWAVERLKGTYFSRDPDRILNIWLFKDAESYQAHAKKFLGDEPSTPYGYYAPGKNALVMNIATGGGTLVHEIVHSFMEANFPVCPAWFNEGLGSLYEQSAERDGKIIGLPNWRLAGLQRAFHGEKVLTFEQLTHLTDREFYGPESGRNYAQARYLCLFLQETGLLQKFYAEFVAHSHEDPTGFNTLKKVLAGDDIQTHERAFEAFVMGLRFP